MGKYLLAGVALVALSTSAMAADVPAYAPEPVAFSWTGAYVGAHGGWGFGSFDIDGGDELDDLEGFVIGGQIGYNWQWDSWVLGLEGDGSFSDQDSDDAEALGLEIENDFLFSIRGRLGFAADRFLIYGTGGAAWQGSSIDTGIDDDEVTYFGWVAGGGIEYAITDNITFGVEYLHYDFDDEEIDVLPAPIFDASADNDVIRGRLNIKFDGIFN